MSEETHTCQSCACPLCHDYEGLWLCARCSELRAEMAELFRPGSAPTKAADVPLDEELPF